MWAPARAAGAPRPDWDQSMTKAGPKIKIFVIRVIALEH
jgi:hypothetical protein